MHTLRALIVRHGQDLIARLHPADIPLPSARPPAPQPPSRTMHSKECVSRGAALQCAMLSPVFKVGKGEELPVWYAAYVAAPT